jgi:transposase
MKTTYKRYSEAFKRQVVLEYEAGISIPNLQKKYDIGGTETIRGWIKKYGKDGFRHEMIRIQTSEEINRIKVLENQVEELQQALGKVMLEKLKLESILDELEESYGVEIKKNAAPSSSSLQEKQKNLDGR